MDITNRLAHPSKTQSQVALRLIEGAAEVSDKVSGNRTLTEGTVAMVLAGGRGTRLANLTEHRAKPALSFGGVYRLIDFTLSNCVHSEIGRIYVCAQYKAEHLIDHIQRAWNQYDRRIGDFIKVVCAQQRPGGREDRGTADAVSQNTELLRSEAPKYVLVLAGDHVYKMDYRHMLFEHTANEADVTVGCVELPIEQASALGVIQVDSKWQITGFEEKPAHPQPLPHRVGWALASMGIYVFNADVLYRSLARDAMTLGSTHDFGNDLIPRLLCSGARVMAHRLSDNCVGSAGRPYWRDVGTLDAFWEANLDLIRNEPAMDLHDSRWPILSAPVMLPPARLVFADGHDRPVGNSLIAGGCLVRNAIVRFSVLSSNVTVDACSVIEESVILPDVEIGRRCVVKRAVIDSCCHLPDGFTVGLDSASDHRRFRVTEHGVALVTPNMLTTINRASPRQLTA
jgi:glucose-1-phosphate adenylyltransferase